LNAKDELAGYRGKVLDSLKRINAKVGDLVRVIKNGKVFEGILIPRSEYGDDEHVVLKLKNGYNVGIRVTSTTQIERIGEGAKPAFTPPLPPKQQEGLPRTVIVSTGGTIASRVDYRTGAVRPALTANDLYSVVPELAEIAQIEAKILFSLFSENITSKHWKQIAEETAGYIQRGVEGVVIAHGTDTMGYTAAALSFALQNLPVPVILVGSQRSADRPSSDAATNLIGAVKAAAYAPFAEVSVAMHADFSDRTILLHKGTKVRKCHTSRRDTFRSVNAEPLAKLELETGEIKMLTKEFNKRDHERKLVLKPNFEDKVALVKFYPGMDSGVIDWYVDSGFKGIVLEGTGLGHVGNFCFDAIRRAIRKDVIVAMTSQCIWGRVNMNVYYQGRDLLAMGVIPLEDMLPETALVKLMWVLGQTSNKDEAKTMLTNNIAGEFSSRTLPEIIGG
jgi:glutamyl-tRNA(Gln) amidotransferase subunit D